MFKSQNHFNALVLEKWEAFIDVNIASKRTYSNAVKQFIIYLQDNKIAEPKREDIMAWRDSLKLKLRATTIQTYLVAVKLFFRWLERENLYKNIADKIKNVRVEPGHKKDFLTCEQSRDVLNNIKTNTLKGLRDYAMISLMLTTGLRTVEVTRADIADIRTVNGNKVLFVQGKGRDDKAEYVKLVPQVENAINIYLKARGDAQGKEPLFASASRNNFGGRITTRSVRQAAKHAMIQAGYDSDRLTAHSMRHTAGTLALLNGANIREVQQLLRHRNINTTMIYAHELERAKNNTEFKIADAIF
ncbi:MAG: tyrosine-type recombinase/integrase [Synergistaceae bacterium]|nr:tyrosine-type recombinase/integrase [Synergistaceae bacterium]